MRRPSGSRRAAAVVGALLLGATGCAGSTAAPSITAATPTSGDGTETVPGAIDEAAGSAGCGAEPLAPGRTELTMVSGGLERSYALYLPAPEADADDSPAPLVIDFPAYSPLELQEAFSGFTRPDDEGVVKSAEVGAVVVTPEPIAGGGTLRAWNLTDFEGWPDDQAFIAELLDEVMAKACIDPDRILAMGFAVGASMASLVACHQADRISVLATVSGLYATPDCQPARPVPIISFHGTDDHLIPFDGGIGDHVPMLGLDPATSAGLAGIVANLAPVPAMAADWATRNDCDDDPDRTTPADGVTLDVWSGCDDEVVTELYVIDGGGHTWPGTNGMDDFGDLLGPVSDALVANDLIWDFFVEQTAR